MRRTGERPKPRPRPRVRFATPAGIPERWFLRRVGSGRYIIVDQDDVPVLEHWDPVTRRENLTIAKSGKLARAVMMHAYNFIQQTSESPFSNWILQLLIDALRDGVPNVRPPSSLVATSSVGGQEEAGPGEDPEGQEAA